MIMCVLLCYPVSIHMSQLLSTGRPISSSLTVLLLSLPIVTDDIASSEPQVLPQLHIKACIATSVWVIFRTFKL